MVRKQKFDSADMLYITLMLALWISVAALFVEGPTGFAVSEAPGYSVDSLEAGGGSVSGSGYSIETSIEPIQGYAEGSGYALAVGSQDYFSEEEETPTALTEPSATSTTQTATGITQGQKISSTDASPPKISSLANYPEQPAVGEAVSYVAEVEDDFSLASAKLEVDGNVIETLTLSGKTSKAEFSSKAVGQAGQQVSWKIIVTDSSGKEKISETKTFSLLAAAPALRECKESKKPKPIDSPCINGKRKDFEFACNSKTGRWESSVKEAGCLAIPTFTEDGRPTAFSSIFLIIAAIIITSLIYVFKKRPELLGKIFKKQEKSESGPLEAAGKFFKN